MALLPGSAAIDTADDAVCPATDQRGVGASAWCALRHRRYEAEPSGDNTAPIADPGGPTWARIDTAIAFDASAAPPTPTATPLTYA